MKAGTKVLGAFGIAAYVAFQGPVSHAVAAHLTSSQPPSHTAAHAVAFAESKVGAAYLWGGNGPAYDCSGLADAAYGGTIDRTSQTEWASETHVSAGDVQAGDLVFFAGSDGTTTSPGHVGIVVNPAKHTMVDAYSTSTGVEYDTYGLPTSRQGLTDPVGFTDPAASSGAAS
jgi:peptidoglycan DL-endopeptidase CwlO